MDTRRSILLIVFMVSLFLLWDAWMRQSATTDSSLATGTTSVIAGDSSAPQPSSAKGASQPQANDASIPQPSLKPDQSSSPTDASITPMAPVSMGERITIKNRDLELVVDSAGGRIVKATLLSQLSNDYSGGFVRLFDDSVDARYEAQTGLVFSTPGGVSPPNHTIVFERLPLQGGQSPERELRLVAESGGVKLLKTIVLADSGYEVKVEHTIVNTGADAITPSIYYQLLRNDSPPPGESSFYMTFTGPALYTDEGKFQKVGFSEIEKGNQAHVKMASDGWVGFIQHYFVSAWVLGNDRLREFFTRKVGDGLFAVGMIQPIQTIAPGAQRSHQATLYVGPQEQRVLEALAPGLDLVVDYGWLTFLAKPIYWLLEQLHKFVGNWGWAIVLLTLIIKLIFYPLSAASYKSMAKMKAVSPRLMQIRERYVNDKAKMNQAMMELYKNEKINPLGGCLPILIQIPVFISLYWVLLASVEMRNAPWILWITDLSHPDPFYILPIVMAITMFIQTKLNPPPPDPVQAKVMMFMPLIFSIFFFFFPAGLVLYWLVNNVVSIAQQWVITKRFNAI
jgi:YidC/Oxa1 family membrane protein insertase